MKTRAIVITETGNLSNSGRISAAMLDRHAKAGKLSITKNNGTYYLNIGTRSVYLWGYYNDYQGICAWTVSRDNWTAADYISGQTDTPISDLPMAWDNEIVFEIFGKTPTRSAGEILAVLAKRCREDFEAKENEIKADTFSVITK